MTVTVLHETAYAKINLALHVRARRPDGYHELETLFAFVDAGDELTVVPSDSLSLTLAGPFADELAGDPDNLVLRAARALREVAGVAEGAAFTLDKRLPIASGIGGGSTDAAAALRLLVRLWGVNPAAVDMFEIAAALGADVPACLGSQTMMGSGVGERLVAADLDIAGLPILLVNPLVACPTGPVFKAWDGQDRGPLDPEKWMQGRNDLEAPALGLVPNIGAVLDALQQQPGVTLARMSGSGATCFALFVNEAARDAAGQAIRAAHPGWWTLAGALR